MSAQRTTHRCRTCGTPVDVARVDITSRTGPAPRFTWGRWAACSGCGSTEQPDLVPDTAAEGYQQAIDTLQGVAERTGSPAARWAAEYLAVDPDCLGPVRRD